jgi:hypothetical protein
MAQKAAEARTAGIKTLTDFLDQDPTGTRKDGVPHAGPAGADPNGKRQWAQYDLYDLFDRPRGTQCGNPPVAERSLTLV